MYQIVFDIGANNGSSCIKFAKEDPNCQVYAFEPTPELVQIIKQQTQNLDNYHIIQKAVSNYTGTAKFNVSANADWGCSSLHEFNDNLQETWPGRTDFKVTKKINVDVICLEDFIKENKIQKIDYLHVDVQGSDLEVLLGLGNEIYKVQAGVIEMPTAHDTKLYKNQKYLDTEAIEYLKQTGFSIQKTESNDFQNNEVNIHFTR